MPLMASVPPLLARPVVEVGQELFLQARRVRPRRAISGIGQEGRSRGLARRSSCPRRGSWRGTLSAAAGSTPGDGDLEVGVAGVKAGFDPLDLAGGERVGAGAQGVADPVERVVLAAAVAEQFLLDPAAGLLHRLEAELDDVEGVQDGGGVLELVADRVAVAAERVQGRSADAGGERVPAGP